MGLPNQNDIIMDFFYVLTLCANYFVRYSISVFGLNTKAAHLNLSDRGSDGGRCRGYWLLLPVLAHPEL